MSKLPDLEGLAIFAKVAQMRSFNGAAGELQVSKATISKAVSRLETRLGTRLFNRSARRLALTEAGRELLPRASHILAEAEAAEDEAVMSSAAPRGHLRIAAPMSFGVLHVAPLLPEFLSLYPDVTVDLHLSDARLDLIGEGLDGAVRIAAMPDSALIVRKLQPMPRFLVGASSYLERHGRPTHPQRLVDHRCIGYASASGETWNFSNAAGETATIRPTGPLRTNNGDAMLPVIVSGLGLGVLPEFMVRRAIDDGQLEILLPEWTLPTVAVYWVTPSAGRKPKRVEVMGEFLARKLANRKAGGADPS
jgi:DNA-binding transcriptional LysR family regulator